MKKAFFDEKTQKFSVCVPISIYKKLKHITIDEETTLADLVRDIVFQFLEDYEKNKH